MREAEDISRPRINGFVSLSSKAAGAEANDLAPDASMELC